MVRCARSDYPSVCGWKAVLSFKAVPYCFHKVYQNVPVNLLSQSEMIDRGIPKSLTTLVKKTFATVSALVSPYNGINLAIFVKRSTTVKIVARYSVFRVGRSVMKSILIDSHGRDGIGNGCNNPTNLVLVDFCC